MNCSLAICSEPKERTNSKLSFFKLENGSQRLLVVLPIINWPTREAYGFKKFRLFFSFVITLYLSAYEKIDFKVLIFLILFKNAEPIIIRGLVDFFNALIRFSLFKFDKLSPRYSVL